MIDHIDVELWPEYLAPDIGGMNALIARVNEINELISEECHIMPLDNLIALIARREATWAEFQRRLVFLRSHGNEELSRMPDDDLDDDS